MHDSKPTRLVGYARVSTEDQDASLQVNALREYGVPEEWIFVEKESGAKAKRPELISAFKCCRAGGELVFWKLDRLGRDVVEVLLTLRRLEEATTAPASAQAEAIELPVELQAEVDTRMAELSAGLSSTIARIHRRATEIAEGRVTEAVKAARAAATAAEAELADAREVLAETDAEVDELEQQLDHARQGESRLRDECAEVKERLAAMTERAETAERHLAEMTGRLDTLVKEADAARERAAAAEAKATEADAERQRVLDRERQLAEPMEALRTFLEAQSGQGKK